MRFVSQFAGAVSACFRGFGILFSPGFRRFMFYPLLVWIVLWGLSFYGSFSLATRLVNLLSSWLQPETWFQYPAWISELAPYVGAVLTFLLKLFFQFLFFMLSGTLIKYAVLILLSPLFSILSEKTEQHLSGRSFPFSGLQLLKDILRGILISLRNMALEYAFIIACFLVTLVMPPLIMISTPLMLIASWYFTGFTLLDYNCERHRYSYRESIGLMKHNKGLVCGTGFVYTLLMALPFRPGAVVGIMLGPAVAVIGGTLSFMQLSGQPQRSSAISR